MKLCSSCLKFFGKTFWAEKPENQLFGSIKPGLDLKSKISAHISCNSIRENLLVSELFLWSNIWLLSAILDLAKIAYFNLRGP